MTALTEDQYDAAYDAMLKKPNIHKRILLRIRKEFEAHWQGTEFPSGRVVKLWPAEKAAFLNSTEGRHLFDRFLIEETGASSIDEAIDRAAP